MDGSGATKPLAALNSVALTPSSGRDSAPISTSIITPSGRYKDLDPAKLRGGYYTPQMVADWLSAWAIRSPSDWFLEPSCGDGNVLVAGIRRLLELGADQEQVSRQVQGVELCSNEANLARNRAKELLGNSRPDIVQAEDFFGWCERETSPSGRVDAVVGNPPFIRYQAFPEPARSRAMSLMGTAGLKTNKLTNIWVPFVVAATEMLRSGGRLALVIPAELLQVSYAAQLRRYLTEKFQRVGLVSCNELFFAGAEQEVLLLLADGAHQRDTTPCRVALVETSTVEEITSRSPAEIMSDVEEKEVRSDSEKWLKYFLSTIEIDFMRELRSCGMTHELSHFAEVDVGIVTGKNEFFVLRKSQLDERGLGNAVRLVSRSAHLKGAIFSEDDWEYLAGEDERVQLLDLREDGGRWLSKPEAAYVDWGERQGFHLGYKCRIRSPWFHLPSAWVPDAFVFRQIYDFPRIVRNDAAASATDTIHRMTTHNCNRDDLIASTYTYVTAASAEIEGRSYGGGVLELEPTEAEKLLVPVNLSHALPLEEMDQQIRLRGIEAVLETNSQAVLMEGLGMSRSDMHLALGVWRKMRERRRSRGRNRRQSK